MGPLALIPCQRKSPEMLFWEGSCLHSSCFQPCVTVGVPPTLGRMPLPMGRARQAWPGSRPRLGLSLGLEKPLPLCRLVEETPRDGHLTAPHRWWDHRSMKNHLHCPSVMLCGYHTQVFISLAIQRPVSFGVESRLGWCTPYFSLCKDFDPLQRMFRLIVILAIRAYWRLSWENLQGGTERN